MTCEEFLESSAAYALGVLDPGESAACVRHLGQPGPHRGCPQAVTDAQAVAASLAGTLPARPPPPQLWRAIEARLGEIPRDPGARRRVWRELAGWFVAAAVIGFYLYSVPLDGRRRAVALEGSPSVVKDAMGLMTEPGTRLVVFVPRRPGAGRATVILNAAERRAVVLCDRAPPAAAGRLRLWTARDGRPPIALESFALSEDGLAWAQVGSALFAPRLPDRLLISADDPGAPTPSDLLLIAELR
jgi:anti-sigma-K factor RskA